MALAVVFFVLDPNKHAIFPRCLFYSLSGAYCPGCGSQRALHNLLHLNIGGVVRHNLLFLPAGAFIIYHYSRSLIDRVFKVNLPNLFYKKNTPWIVLAAVILFFIARNLPWYPFTELAPG